MGYCAERNIINLLEAVIGKRIRRTRSSARETTGPTARLEYEPYWETLTPVEPPERGLPEFRDVTVRNVAEDTEERGWYANGYPERPIRDVRFEDVSIEAPAAGEIRHAENWTMEDVTVRTEDGADVELTDCRDVDRPEIE